jgi:hypothetical protein
VAPIVWISEKLEDGQAAFRIGRAGDELVADFVGLGLLRANSTGTSSSFEPSVGADPIALDKLREGLIPALLRHLHRELTLHGAAVTVEGRAIACVGISGAGKSTFAARLCSDRGALLLADDTTAIDFVGSTPTVLPTERVHWLISGRATPHPEEGDTKEAVAPRALASASSPLVLVCRLRFDDAVVGPRVTRLRGHDAFEALVPSVVRFAIDDRQAHLREAEQLGSLVRSVPVYDVVRSHRGEASLAATLECLFDLVRRTVEGEP